MSASPPLFRMPLRVPELASAVGRLVVPRRLAAPWVPLDDVREELATAVFELGGAARAAGARDDRGAVLAALGRAQWLAAWEQAVRRTADRVADRVDAEIEAHGRAARMPRRRRHARRLSAGERRAVAARLGAGGGPFVDALAELERAAAAVRDADATQHDRLADWHGALTTAARRLEAAWLALESAVEDERRRWEPEIAEVAAWRPPLWPVLLWWVPFAAALLWLGLVLGGYVDAPRWLAARLGF